MEAAFARAGPRSPVATGAVAGRADRHGRPGRRVGLEPRLDAAAVAGVAAARGGRRRASSPPWPPARSAASSGARSSGRWTADEVGCRTPATAPQARAHRAALAGFLVLVAVIALGPADLLGRPDARHRGAHRRAVERRARGRRRRSGSARRTRSEDAHFANVTAWQGGGSVVSDARAGRARRLPDHRAGPGARRLEGDGARAHRRLAGRRADLPAARPGDPGAGGARRGRASRARSCATSRSSSASRRTTCRAR